MPAREPFLKKFGRNVRYRRQARDLSQEALAAEANLDRTYIGGIERGERNPTIVSAVRIAKALNSTVADLCADIDR